jgi:hypothetical protein
MFPKNDFATSITINNNKSAGGLFGAHKESSKKEATTF